MDYAFDYYLETEVSLRIISLAKLSPMNIKNLKDLLKVQTYFWFWKSLTENMG